MLKLNEEKKKKKRKESSTRRMKWYQFSDDSARNHRAFACLQKCFYKWIIQQLLPINLMKFILNYSVCLRLCVFRLKQWQWLVAAWWSNRMSFALLHDDVENKNGNLSLAVSGRPQKSEQQRLLLSCCGRRRSERAADIKHNHKSRMVNEIQMQTTANNVCAVFCVQSANVDHHHIVIIIR